MKIYTRNGDAGDTIRLDGQRVRKCHPLVIAGGAVDELGAHVGLCLAAGRETGSFADVLELVQRDLFAVGAALAAAGTALTVPAAVDDATVERLEADIDAASAELPPLNAFILPGGSELAARLHVARCVCRRAEREVVAAVEAGCGIPEIVLQYLNRLGDLLFALARRANLAAGAEDRTWQR